MEGMGTFIQLSNFLSYIILAKTNQTALSRSYLHFNLLFNRNGMEVAIDIACVNLKDPNGSGNVFPTCDWGLRWSKKRGKQNHVLVCWILREKKKKKKRSATRVNFKVSYLHR
jgi:hypothetical protein